MGARKPLSYEGYLHLEELLSLQRPRSKPTQHDELLFIASHQTYELWFKTMLHELQSAISLMGSGELPESARLIRRVVAIQKILIQQLEVLETIKSTDFLKFRSVLRPASGFQSLQFRELEFLSGHQDERFLDLHKDDPRGRLSLEKRLHSPTLWDAFVGVLKTKGFKVGRTNGQHGTELDAVVEVYSNPEYADVADLAEALLEYDKHFWLWRNHHMGMVERIIGRKIGTGAETVKETIGPYSFDPSGVAYLKTTLRRRFFPILWAARTKLSEG